MEQASEKRGSGRGRRYTILILAAIFIFGTVQALTNRGGSVSVQMDGSMLGVLGSYGEPLFIKFEEITQIRLDNAVSFGSVIEGEERSNTVSGRYENDAFGAYTLHAYKESAPYIVVSYGEGDTLVFNQKTAKLTREIYADLTAQIA